MLMYRIYFLIALSFLVGCGSSHSPNYSRGCPKLLKNNFIAIGFDSFKIETIKDMPTVNRLKFFCVENHGYTQKLMYDQFGTWTTAYPSKGNNNWLLVWKDIDLLSNGKKYSIYTSGLDDRNGPLYASVIVLDENKNDMLAEDSTIKELLIEYFSSKIKDLDNSTDFAKEFLTRLNPEIWAKYYKNNPAYN